MTRINLIMDKKKRCAGRIQQSILIHTHKFATMMMTQYLQLVYCVNLTRIGRAIWLV